MTSGTLLSELIISCIESAIHTEHVQTCRDWAERSYRKSRLSLHQLEVIQTLSNYKEKKLMQELAQKRGIPPHLIKTEVRLKAEANYKERMGRLRIVKAST